MPIRKTLALLLDRHILRYLLLDLVLVIYLLVYYLLLHLPILLTILIRPLLIRILSLEVRANPRPFYFPLHPRIYLMAVELRILLLPLREPPIHVRYSLRDVVPDTLLGALIGIPYLTYPSSNNSLY